MNTKILPHLTIAQTLIIITAIELVFIGYMISIVNYNADISQHSQDSIKILIQNQGNISNVQREKIIKEFENLPTSGFASRDQVDQIIHLLNRTK